jgi:DNA-binding IclR family transcriptional regulator
VISVWGPESRVPRARLPVLGKLTLDAAGQVRELLR